MASWHTEQLGALLGAACDAGNQVLAAPGDPPPPFLFAPGTDQPLQAIPGAQFGRHDRLELAEIVLTLHGYGVAHRFAAGAAMETVFMLGRPPLWRRLARPPLLTLRIEARRGARAAQFEVKADVAARARAVDPQRRRVLLSPALQEALLRMHAARQPRTPWRGLLARWLGR